MQKKAIFSSIVTILDVFYIKNRKDTQIMKIDYDALKQQLIELLDANMEGETNGGTIMIDSDGNITDSTTDANGKKRWLHTVFEIHCSDEEFHLLVNPKLNFKQEIDLMDEDIPDTVPEAVEFLWEDICCGIIEYEACFNGE